MVHLSLLSVYNFIRRGLVRGLAEKAAKSKSKSKSMAFKSKSKSSKSGLKFGLKSKSGLEYYKSDKHLFTLLVWATSRNRHCGIHARLRFPSSLSATTSVERGNDSRERHVTDRFSRSLAVVWSNWIESCTAASSKAVRSRFRTSVQSVLAPHRFSPPIQERQCIGL